MVYRIILCVIALAIMFGGYLIWTKQKAQTFFSTPKAAFTVLQEGNQNGPVIVEFLNYGCQSCRQTHLLLIDYVQKNPDIRFVVRPVPVIPEEAYIAAERVLAAGIQGKFAEMDKALSEYDGPYDDKFYREAASLYEIDYERWIKDAGGDDVRALAQDNVTALGKAGIETTPALMIGNVLYQLEDALTLPELLRMVKSGETRQ